MDTVTYKYLGSLSDLAHKVVGTVFICKECQVTKDVILSKDEIKALSLVQYQDNDPFLRASVDCRYCNSTTIVTVELAVDRTLQREVYP